MKFSLELVVMSFAGGVLGLVATGLIAMVGALNFWLVFLLYALTASFGMLLGFWWIERKNRDGMLEVGKDGLRVRKVA